MSELYQDEIKKLEYYRKLITDRHLKQGTLAGKEKIQAQLSTVNTKLALFKQSYISSGKTMDPEMFNAQQESFYYGPRMAVSVMSAIPLTILYLILQKHIVASIAVSGIKQ